METKKQHEHQPKSFQQLRIKSGIHPATSSVTHTRFGTTDDQNHIGHSRNSRKVHTYTGSRD